MGWPVSDREATCDESGEGCSLKNRREKGRGRTPTPLDVPGYASIAKITQPVSKGILPRVRLFDRLDACREYPVTWVSSPAGSGKTSLVASYLSERKVPRIWYRVDEGDGDIATFFYYMGLAAKMAAPGKLHSLPVLTPEYLLGIPTFTLRYFENLYGRLKPPFVFVFDNFQLAPPRSQFQEIIRNGLDILPDGINVIIISRESPPPQFSRLKVSRQVAMLHAVEIRFTPEESREMIRLKGLPGVSDKTIHRIHERTRGWAAGLLLMAETAEAKDTVDPNLSDHTLQEVFDYLASEVFEKSDQETREFLLRTAFLPGMTVGMASKLTGSASAGDILLRLSRSHFFTEKDAEHDPVFRYHPLFRGFLQARARKEFTQVEITGIQRTSAALLMEAGRREEAAGLFIDAGDWEGFVPFLLGNAPLLMAQGRIQTLEDWLAGIPVEIIENTPWLLNWLGVCRMGFNPAQGRAHFERAFQSFSDMGDDAGALTAWCGVVDTLIYEFDDFKPLDRWIEWLDKYAAETPSFPGHVNEARVASSMSAALVWRRPTHPDTNSWVGRTLSLSIKDSEIALYLPSCIQALNYCLWMGRTAEVRIVLDRLKRTAESPSSHPLVKIAVKGIEAYFCLFGDDCDRTRELASEGLAMAAETGIRILDFVLLAGATLAAVIKGDKVLTEGFFKRLEDVLDPRRRNNLSLHLHLLSLHNLHAGNIPEAVVFAEKSLEIAAETGTPIPEAFCRIVLAQAVHEAGDRRRAEEQLAFAEYILTQIGCEYFLFTCGLVRAFFALDKGMESEGTEILGKTLPVGREKGYFNAPCLWRRQIMSRLCAKALVAGVEVEYVQELIRKQRLVPDAGAAELEHWPWLVKVYTLGGFELIVDGNPVRFTGKVQKKPLDLLKALISLGGQDIREEQLTELLWPEAEGDQAHNAFTTTLSRLRRLVGLDEVIENKGGRVSLNTTFCWVDAWAFETLLGRMEALWTRLAATGKDDGREIAKGTGLEEKAIGAYGGVFLQGEEMHQWVMRARKRLQKKFDLLVTNCGKRLEAAGEWEKASQYYRKAIDLGESVDEELYRRLMICHMRIGDPDRAIKIYQQCRKMLAMTLGAKPSARTEEIYRELI
jgi:LuxR family maltose regulon positive regulatory protein